MSDRHLLVVDDDDRIRDLLKQFLNRGGFRVTTAANAEGAERLLGTLDFDLVILDVMMPGEDGMSFARRLRATPGPTAKAPILMLTARGETADRIEGLSAGVDDYLAKPFEPQELMLRIEAILRRAGPRASGEAPLSLGRCKFDPVRGELTRDGAPVRLTEAEVDLLRTLAKAPHAPIDRYTLARDDADAAGRAVDVQVTRLRRKIEDDPKTPRYLQTVRGVGYLLAPD
ncbi:response regulator [Caulobacter sp. SLTY]|uniref:response regulator n=1 Tax=Caulobacter sp. SLTY TaxID=2683262 RepID=UPI0014136873|nr:response regulator [Caulobacter sp. SLTY]NBB14017.1 response regulator [Caulobacter sp. SLTY]